MKVKRWAFTLLLVLAMLVTTPGFSLVFAADGAATARVDVSIAEGESADVVVILKSVDVTGVKAASVASTLKAGAARAQAAVADLVTASGGKVVNSFWINNSVLARVDAATLEKLARTPGVERIVPNFKLYALDDGAQAAAAAPGKASPYGPTPELTMIGAPMAWYDYGVTGGGVKVAVLDTGVDPLHPDLAGKIGAFQEFDGSGFPIVSPPHDSDIHGTHVSGTIAGGSASGMDIGVAPGALLWEGLVLPEGSGTWTQVMAGMQWAIDEGVDVVNMSFGPPGGGYIDVLIPPVRAMAAAGIVPVGAIGNDGPGYTGSPGNILESWGIGAVDSSGTVASFSGGEVVDKSWFDSPPPEWPPSYVKPDLSAPGVDVYSSIPGGGWGYLSGTSMATPHVAGAAALMIEYWRVYLDAAAYNPVGLLFDALKNTAEDRGDPGLDTRYGWGLINVHSAIGALGGGPAAPNIYVNPGWPDTVVIGPDDPNTYSYTLGIGNSGDADLEYWFWVDWMGGPSDWLWTSYGGGVTPPASESFFDVFFNAFYAYGGATATALPPGDYYADLVIESNDPDTPSLRLQAHLQVGWGVAPSIWVSPEFLMINVERGSEAAANVTIGNEGSADLLWNISDRFAMGGAASASALPEPQGSDKPREWTANKAASDGASALMRPAGGKKFEGDQLLIGISDYGELDWADPVPPGPGSSWGIGHGFEYKPARPDSDYRDWIPGTAESLAQGWHGEGYVVYYDGMTSYSYPDGTWGIQPVGRETIVDNPDEAKHRVNVRTDDNRLKISHTFKLDKHGRSVILTTEITNAGGSFIGDLRYKRVFDWDANAGPGDDINWMFDPDYYLISTVDPPSGAYADGQYYAYGTAALGDSWPMVYDWDLNAWDDWWTIDHGWDWRQNGPEDPLDGDWNGALYFALGSLAPGERKVVSLIYTVGQGESAEEAYDDLLSNLGTVGGDVPWLSESPTEGTVGPGGAWDTTVTVDARGLSLGSYFAQLVIRSNDPGRPRVTIPVQVNVMPRTRWMIDDPEDVQGDPKVDIDKVGVQLTRDSAMFLTTFYGNLPGDVPLVSIMMMDVDEDVGTGYTGPMANDIGADYMAFGFVYPGTGGASLSAIKSADLSAYAKLLPGLDVAAIKNGMLRSAADGASGELFLFIWVEGTGPGGRGAWLPVMTSYTIGLNDSTMFQFLWLVTMVDDGSMKVVQSAGDIWDIFDTAPDRGHGSTIPASDLSVSGLSAVTVEVGEPEFLTGQTVLVSAVLGNEGDDIERDLWLNFEVYPILESVPTEPGEPGYPEPTLTLLDPIPLGSVLVEQINPGETVELGTTWTPELVADPRPEGDPDRSPDGYLHDYLLKASVEALPRETEVTNNADTLQVRVDVGYEVGLSDLYVSDTLPGGAGAADAVDTVYTGLGYWIQATVTNNGTLDIYGYNVVFYVDGEEVGSYYVEELLSGDSATAWTEWWPAAPGSNVPVEAVGDSFTGELNYEDNAAGTTVDVVSGIDVAVTSLTITPAGGTYNYADLLTFTAHVVNQGQVPLYDVLVSFFVAGVPIEPEGARAAATIAELAPGAFEDVAVLWGADILGIGLQGQASIEPLEGEADTADNSARSTLFRVNGQDVGISNIRVMPPTGLPGPKKGKLSYVKVTVNNYGTTTMSFKVRLLQVSPPGPSGPLPIGTPQTVTSLLPGRSMVKSFSWTPGVYGSVVLRAELGTTAATWTPLPSPPDINPDNNVREQGVMVAASVTDVAVTGVDLAKTPLAGTVSKVKVAVANEGNERASFTVELYADGTLVKSTRVNNMASYSSKVLNFNWKPAAMGDYTL
ncbi:MAG: S8 family serine peptidase, partial [Chloroflexota bacterium]